MESIWSPGGIAAICSALATLFAAFAAWRGPRSAAIIGERMRSNSELQNEKRRLKLHVFTTIMQERAHLHSVEGVRALNLIDIVFLDSPNVRNAWAELYQTFIPTNKVPDHAKADRVRDLLKAMAQDLGLGDQLKPDDFVRCYFPDALAQERLIQELSRKRELDRLLGESRPAANTSPQGTIWPPAPQ